MRTELHRALLSERLATLEQQAALTRNFDVIVEASAAVATDDEHDPEGATIAFERAQVTALREHVVRHLADIGGVWRTSRMVRTASASDAPNPSPAERLAVRPAARRCVACASAASGHSAAGMDPRTDL